MKLKSVGGWCIIVFCAKYTKPPSLLRIQDVREHLHTQKHADATDGVKERTAHMHRLCAAMHQLIQVVVHQHDALAGEQRVRAQRHLDNGGLMKSAPCMRRHCAERGLRVRMEVVVSGDLLGVASIHIFSAEARDAKASRTNPSVSRPARPSSSS